MMLLLSLITICSIWVIGLKIVTGTGMAGRKIGEFARIKVEEEGKSIYKPLIYCAWCMPSIHSLFAFGFAFGMGIIPELSYRLIYYYPLVVAGASFLSGIMWMFLELLMGLVYGDGEEDDDDDILEEQRQRIYNESIDN